MSDSAVIAILMENGVWLYLESRWGGSFTVEQALGKALFTAEAAPLAGPHGRLEDEPYLARIVFEEILKTRPEELSPVFDAATTGFGISTVEPDSDYPVVYVTPGWPGKIQRGDEQWTIEEYMKKHRANLYPAV